MNNNEHFIINIVNKKLPWKKSASTLGAMRVWYDTDKNGKLHTLVDVDIADGINCIDFKKFIKLITTKNIITQEDFLECTY